VALLNRVPRFRFDWLVPGLLREKCIALVKGLPKEKRKRLVPAPDYVDKALAQLLTQRQPDNVDLLDALSRCLASLGGVALGRDDWALEKLDDYYRMNVRVVDAQGHLLQQGRDLGELIERFRADTRQSISSSEQNPRRGRGLAAGILGSYPGSGASARPAWISCLTQHW
ncbi:MAG: ATP-dependent RNA helicase HrpA, partial [Gammaproteobacteria bacterium]